MISELNLAGVFIVGGILFMENFKYLPRSLGKVRTQKVYREIIT